MSKFRMFFAAVILALSFAHPAHAVNSIVVESRNFEVGQTACSLGIWLNNDVHVTGLVLMIEARAVSGGAFYLSGNPLTRPNRQASGRLNNSPLGSAGPNWPAASTTNNRYPTPGGAECSGPVSNTYQTAAAAIDAIPPDGWLFSCVSTGDGNFGQDIDLDPGNDPLTRDSASWIFIFNANNVLGCFEIDSCCVRPSGHTSMVDLNTNLVPVDFAKGVVCLESDVNQAPVINCPSSVTQSKDPGQGGAVVNYSVTYFDEDMTLVPVCSPTSGSFFPIGTTYVTCIVTDTFGLADTCEFPVIVVDAEGNHVTVESESFFINQSACTVRVYLSNVIPIVGIVMPLDLRSLSGGAFYQTPEGGSTFFSRRIGGRLDLSPLGSTDPGGDWPAASTTLNRYDNSGGAPCGQRTYQTTVSEVGGTSPDAVLYACVSAGDANAGEEIQLLAGADPLTPGSESWRFVFNANGNIGCFEIDTCCTRPSSHLSFLDNQTSLQPVGFTKGTICLELNPGVNYPPSISCPSVIWQAVDGSGTGAVVNFTVNVSDEDPTLQAVCIPPTGSFFVLGTTPVTCIATDTAGLADTCTFDVVIHDADEDAVVIESKTFQPGQVACSVGVFLENTVPITGLVLMLEARSLTNSAFYLGGNPLTRPNRQSGQRLDLSPLGSADSNGQWPAASTTNNRYDTIVTPECSGPNSNTYQTAVAMTPGTSPDGWLYSSVSQGDPSQGELISLVPGSDPQYTSSASWVFVFDMDTLEGCFEIDTCCVRPSGHLSFLDESTNQIAPAFTKSTICIAYCDCDCHANPAVCSDPAVNVVDVLYTINVAFRGFAEIDDDNPACPINATDVNCDGVSSVIDVIKMIDVAFRAGDPATAFCNPCP